MIEIMKTDEVTTLTKTKNKTATTKTKTTTTTTAATIKKLTRMEFVKNKHVDVW